MCDVQALVASKRLTRAAPVPSIASMHRERHPFRHHARVLAAALVGTAVEFYDFYVYATAAALVFGPLFFRPKAPMRNCCLA